MSGRNGFGEEVGAGGPGTFTQSGGTNTGAEIDVGIGGNSGSVGIYNLKRWTVDRRDRDS